MSSYAITAGHLPIASGAAPLPAADALEGHHHPVGRPDRHHDPQGDARLTLQSDRALAVRPHYSDLKDRLPPAADSIQELR